MVLWFSFLSLLLSISCPFIPFLMEFLILTFLSVLLVSPWHRHFHVCQAVLQLLTPTTLGWDFSVRGDRSRALVSCNQKCQGITCHRNNLSVTCWTGLRSAYFPGETSKQLCGSTACPLPSNIPQHSHSTVGLTIHLLKDAGSCFGQYHDQAAMNLHMWIFV